MAKFAGPDFICCVTGRSGADIHHIYTQKARPDLIEKPWNQIPLSHHLHVLAHSKNMSYMAREYIAIRMWMINNGWEYEAWRRKWVHPAACTSEIN